MTRPTASRGAGAATLSQQVPAVAGRDRGGPTGNVQFREDVLKVGLDGGFADERGRGDRVAQCRGGLEGGASQRRGADISIGHFRDAAKKARYTAAYDTAMSVMEPPSRSCDAASSFGTVRTYVWEGRRKRDAPVVLLPGQSSGVPMWAKNLPSFRASGRTIVAFDAIGDAGMSVQTASLRSVADQATWIEEALGQLGYPHVHSVGHSFGAATAAHHALRHSARLASLTLLEPVFILRWPPPETFVWATVALLPGPSSWRDHALAAIGGATVDEVRVASPIGDLIAAATEAFDSALPTPRPLSTAQLEALHMPVYVAIAGRGSQAGGTKAAARARAHLPNATVEVWADATHSLPMQEHEALGQRLCRFWDDVEPVG